MALLLLEAGANPNARNNEGETPLHHVYMGVHSAGLEFVVHLLDAGADPNARDNLGHLPFHRGGHGSHKVVQPAIERAFMRAGADPNLLDGNGEYYHCSTLECLEKKDYTQPIGELEPVRGQGDLSVFQFLIDEGVWRGGVHIVSFEGYGRTLTGAEVIVGKILNGRAESPPSELGFTADVLPRLPSMHSYRYAWVITLTDEEEVRFWQETHQTSATTLCQVYLFDLFSRDGNEKMVSPEVMYMITARANGECVPENGKEYISAGTQIDSVLFTREGL